MYHLPRLVLGRSEFKFCTPSEAAEQLQVRGSISVDNPISWADMERDLSAWLGNHIQDDAFESLYRLEEKVKRIKDADIHRDWRYLQTSDHFYYMCTKFFNDGDVHKYFNHYNTPYEAFINFMNVLTDFEERVNKHIKALDAKVDKKTAPEVKEVAAKKEAPKKAVAVKKAAPVKKKVEAKKKAAPAKKKEEPKKKVVAKKAAPKKKK
jgi:alpha-amylase